MMGAWIGACAFAALGFFMGSYGARRRALRHAKPFNGPTSLDLLRLERRIQFAQNARMRLEELSHQHATLSKETDVLEALRRVKRGTSQMLALLAAKLQPPHPITTEEAENLEGLLGASGKALRLTLDLGRAPHMSKDDWEPKAQSIQKSLENFLPKGNVLIIANQKDAMPHLVKMFDEFERLQDRTAEATSSTFN